MEHIETLRKLVRILKNSEIRGDKYMKCKKCGYESCGLVAEKSKKGKDYAWGRGLLGTAVFGPLGSAIGWTKGKELTVRAYWVCKKCGYKFEA